MWTSFSNKYIDFIWFSILGVDSHPVFAIEIWLYLKYCVENPSARDRTSF